MIDNQHQPHAGCVGTQDTDAGRVPDLGTAGRVNADAPIGCSSTGCAATATDGNTDATPATPPQTLREFERAMRALGFTRPQAEAIARKGFSGAAATSAQQPEPDESDNLRAALQQLARTLKGSP